MLALLETCVTPVARQPRHRSWPNHISISRIYGGLYNDTINIFFTSIGGGIALAFEVVKRIISRTDMYLLFLVMYRWTFGIAIKFHFQTLRADGLHH